MVDGQLLTPFFLLTDLMVNENVFRVLDGGHVF